jgi:DNA-binding Lrp family transcriptional regulator
VRKSVASTAAERIRQLVLHEGRASMPELQRQLKLEKSAVHYYARKLAAEGRVVLMYEPHEASHSLVLVAWDPALVPPTRRVRGAWPLAKAQNGA